MAKVKVEFIESYIHGIDDEDSGSYIWNDNHGELIRCKDCKHSKGDVFDRGLYCTHHPMDVEPDDYCSYGERKEQ